MAAKNPRTRRQLREKLDEYRDDNMALELRVSEHEVRLQGKNHRIEQAEHDLRIATRALEKSGFQGTPGVTTIGRYGNLLSTDWYQPNEAAEKAAREAEAKTRAETLEAVIRALQIPGYRGNLIDVYDDSQNRIDTEKFWADIQTALEVRAERKAADERAKTEEKVAGLAVPKVAVGGLIDGAALRDLIRDSRSWMHHPYATRRAAGSSYHGGPSVSLSDYDRDLLESIKSAADLAAGLGIDREDAAPSWLNDEADKDAFEKPVKPEKPAKKKSEDTK